MFRRDDFMAKGLADGDITARVKESILQKISDARHRLSPADIRQDMVRRHGVDPKTVSAAVRALVSENLIRYTNQFGCTFLEMSYDRPVRITEKIVLTPPNAPYPGDSGETVIILAPGAAFGTGEHPSTRLALQGVGIALGDGDSKPNPNTRMLDIGTGSGVLGIASVLMGIASAVCSDIDPCARAEAAHNIALNGLSDRIRVVDETPDATDARFSLITANLRAPTLCALKDAIAAGLADGGAIVLSGIKTEEREEIKAEYEDGRLQCRWEAVEKGWAAMVFIA